MFGSFGIPELMIVLGFVPMAGALWVLWTLHRIRAGQQTIAAQLESIVRTLQSGRQVG